jgi:secreted trypsin-like serine protease
MVGAAQPAGAVVGASAIQIQSAPWTVLITQDSGWGVLRCGGSILDPQHVVTAAHCAFDISGTQVPVSALSVRAGISNVSSPSPADSEQDRSVSAIRVAPGYLWTGGPAANDVAVLTLAQPLTLGGTSAQALALPPPSAPFPAGAHASVAGFGKQSASSPSDGSLRQLPVLVDTQATCDQVAAPVLQSVTTALCVNTPGGAICEGDSGSALVTTEGSPVLLGIVSGGPSNCPPGSDGIFTWVGAPQIMSFLNEGAPPAPAAQQPAAIARVAARTTHRRHAPARTTLTALPKT